MAIRLLDNVSVDTSEPGTKFPVPGGGSLTRDHKFSIFVWGTLGGGKVTVQISPDGGSNWFTARTPNDNQLTFTIADMKVAELRAPTVRAMLSGSSGASGVNCYMY